LGAGVGLWNLMELAQKPNSGFPVGVDFDRKAQFWAKLGATTNDVEKVWSGGCDQPQPNHYNTIRQWQELGFWFESLSIAAGNGPVSNLTNFSFTTVGMENPVTNFELTHSYLTEKPFYQVRDGFVQIRNSLRVP
jgi:hypothetical protein